MSGDINPPGFPGKVRSLSARTVLHAAAAAMALGGGLPMPRARELHQQRDAATPKTRDQRQEAASFKRARKDCARARAAWHEELSRRKAVRLTDKPPRKTARLSTHAEKRARRRALRAFRLPSEDA